MKCFMGIRGQWLRHQAASTVRITTMCKHCGRNQSTTVIKSKMWWFLVSLQLAFSAVTGNGTNTHSAMNITSGCQAPVNRLGSKPMKRCLNLSTWSNSTQCQSDDDLVIPAGILSGGGGGGYMVTSGSSMLVCDEH